MLKMIFRLFLIMLILWSCATIRKNSIFRYDSNHDEKVPELEDTRKVLKNISNGALGDDKVSLAFIKAPEKEKEGTVLLGECNYTISHGRYEIDIVKTRWDRMSTIKKVMTLAHEFGHCQCVYFKHKDEELEDGCPKSLMNGLLADENCLYKHWTRYSEEMKNGCKSWE